MSYATTADMASDCVAAARWLLEKHAWMAVETEYDRRDKKHAHGALPPPITEEDRATAKRMRAEGYTARQIAGHMGRHESTINRIWK